MLLELSVLREKIDRPIALSPRIWAKALLLGEARRLTNADRHKSAERGAVGNQEVDLHGALGELVLLTIVERSEGKQSATTMAAHMFNPLGGRSVEGPDLLVCDRDGHTHGVDAKTFDCSASKRFFAINGTKHANLRGLCSWYFALLVPRFGQQAELAKLVPYDDVQRWDASNLRAANATGGSISRNMPIQAFVSKYFSRSIDIRGLRESTYSKLEVMRLANDDAVRIELFTWLPKARATLDGRHFKIDGSRKL